MGRDELINLRGLHPNPNQFLTPNGAMRTATNMWLTRPGLLQKRRGFQRWSGTLGQSVKKLFAYRGILFAFEMDDTGTGELKAVATDGTVSSISTPAGFDVQEPFDAFGARNRGCIAGKNFYFTDRTHPYRVSNTTMKRAGGIAAPGFDTDDVPGTVLTDAGSGFLADGYSVAYRYELVTFDSYDREIVGAVCGRMIASNISGVTGYSAGDASNVTVRALIPAEATEDDLIRIYRSAQKVSGQALDDDLKLVYEYQLKNGDVQAGYFEVKDIVPDGLRGDFIYTAPNAAEGIGQNNERPPFCLDIAEHKGRAWYANTTRPSEFELQILAVGGSDGIQITDTFLINGREYAAGTTGHGSGEYLLVTSGTASYNIEQSAMNLCSAINKDSGNTTFYATYISGPNDVPGKILIYSREPGFLLSGINVAAGGKRDCFNPSLLPGEHIVNLTRAANVVTATVTSGSQSFKVGERVVIGPGGSGSGGSVFGTGPFQVTAVTATTFSYSETGANGTLNGQSATIYSDTVSTFRMESKPNRLYYSKFLEPDAVPRDNWIDVGAEDKAIVAIAAQGETLQVWKEDGIYRIVGTDELSFEPLEVLTTVKALAREMVVKFQGKVVGLTNVGLLSVSETGVVDDIDFPIRNLILAQITYQDTVTPWFGSNTSLTSLSFMVPYESENMLLVMFGGNKDIASGALGLCNFGYLYNGAADEWTYWAFDANDGDGNGKLCGIENPADSRLYFGDSYNTFTANTFIYKERKDRTSGVYPSNDHLDQYGSGDSSAIAAAVSPVIQTARAPGLDKQWNEIALLFNGFQPSQLIVADETENGGGQSQVLNPGAMYGSRLWLHDECARSRVLMLTVTHAIASEGFELAGIQVDYEVLGPAAERQ